MRKRDAVFRGTTDAGKAYDGDEELGRTLGLSRQHKRSEFFKVCMTMLPKLSRPSPQVSESGARRAWPSLAGFGTCLVRSGRLRPDLRPCRGRRTIFSGRSITDAGRNREKETAGEWDRRLMGTVTRGAGNRQNAGGPATGRFADFNRGTVGNKVFQLAER